MKLRRLWSGGGNRAIDAIDTIDTSELKMHVSGERVRRRPVEMCDDFFMITPQNVLKTYCISCDLTQATKIKSEDVKVNSLNWIHQNITGLRYKVDELNCLLTSYDLSPSVICITEQKLLLINLENYCLSSQFSRSLNKGGGVSIYCKLDMDCNPIDISQYCMEKVIEACAAWLNIDNNYFIILCIYGSPCGKMENFINYLKLILKSV
jgi:hypothetical protein